MLVNKKIRRSNKKKIAFLFTLKVTRKTIFFVLNNKIKLNYNKENILLLDCKNIKNKRLDKIYENNYLL